MRLGGLNKALARGHIIVLGFELRRGAFGWSAASWKPVKSLCGRMKSTTFLCHSSGKIKSFSRKDQSRILQNTADFDSAIMRP